MILFRSYITLFATCFYDDQVFGLRLNRAYFAFLVSFEATVDIGRMSLHLLLLGALEFVCSGVYITLLRRRLGVAALYLLAFVLRLQWILVQVTSCQPPSTVSSASVGATPSSEVFSQAVLHILLATVVTFVAASTFTTATALKSPPVNPSNVNVASVNGGRLLRVANTVDADASTAGKAEERGATSAIKSWVKIKYWVGADKSDDYVKKKLGLQGLKGATLINHPNYKTLEKFWYKLEGRELDEWFEQGLTMHGAWKFLQLDRVNAAQVANTDRYKAYMRYVKRYDDMIYWHKNSLLQPPIEYGGSPAELFAKVKVWAAADRPRWYVKEALELDDLSKVELVRDPYYKEFLALTGKKP